MRDLARRLHGQSLRPCLRLSVKPVLKLKAVFTSALTLLSLSGSAAFAQSTSSLKLVYFTADWCPTCKVLDPRLDQALRELDDQDIQPIAVDMTVTRAGDLFERNRFWKTGLQNDMNRSGIGYLFNSVKGFPYTGYAVVITEGQSAPLTCIMGVVPLETIKSELRRAKTLAQRPAHKGLASVETNCPTSFRMTGSGSS